MKKVLFAVLAVVWVFPAVAQTVAVYPVKSEGFSLNQSDVSEMSRLVAQACVDQGFKCAYRGSSNYEKEGGSKVNADFVAEFVLTGKTREKGFVGPKSSGIGVFAGKAKHLGGGMLAGAGGAAQFAGIGVKADSMNVTGQFTGKDGFISCSKNKSKLGLKGELILGGGRSDNTDKLLKAFRNIFEECRKNLS